VRAVTPTTILSTTIAVAAILCAGVVTASAATLGGLKTNDLGAATGTVAAHTAGINVRWRAVRTGTTWVVNQIRLTTTGTDTFANGEKIRVTLIATSGASICEIAVTQAGASATQTIARTTIDTACGASGVNYALIARVAVRTGT
jgi:hypothetical protein